jgi:hypothetical protein
MANYEYEEKKLEKFKYMLYTQMSRELVDVLTDIPDIDISTHDTFFCSEIILRVKGFVWGENLQSETIQAPRDWWEHFKERWFPAWALRRWPVQYTGKTLTARALYPLLSFPEERSAIHFLMRDFDGAQEAQ